MSRLWSCKMQNLRVARGLSQTMIRHAWCQLQDDGADLTTNGLLPASCAL